MTEILQTVVVPHSTEGHSIHDVDRIDGSNIHDFLPDAGRRAEARRHLEGLGFEVHEFGGPALIVRGRKSLFEARFGSLLIPRSFDLCNAVDGVGSIEVHHPRDSKIPGLIEISENTHPELGRLVRGASVTEPVELFSEVSAEPPSVGYHHFDLPGGVVEALNAGPAHAAGFDGSGVRVAVCDSGFYLHPWFTQRGLRADVVTLPDAADPDKDRVGHGTAVAANLFSVAPGCEMTAIKMNFLSDAGSADAVPALQKAAELGAQVINCSWGSDVADKKAMTAHTRTLEYVVSYLVYDGRLLLFASGDYPRADPSSSGMFAFPAQHPSVIAVGGACVDSEGKLAAASYASGFRSMVYDHRDVPDVCGLCGQMPGGVLIMSPMAPGCSIDRIAAQNPYPDGDDTAPDDGWVCLSGTSLATPHVSGVAALMLQANPSLGGDKEVRAGLVLSARSVDVGHSNPNATHDGKPNQAKPGVDVATGAGFVDATRAVLLARMLRAADEGDEVRILADFDRGK